MKVLSLGVLAAIGIGVSFAFLPAMALMFVMPVIAFAQPCRRMAFLAAFTYYAGASWAIIPAIRNFFGPDAGPASGVFLWLAASTLLAVLCAVCANVAFPGPPKPPVGWEAVDTNLNSGTALADFQSVQWLQRRALGSHANVVIFPESVVSTWTEATEALWQATLADLRASGKTIVLGVCTPLIGRLSYQNRALIAGAEAGSVSQRIPVPLGMWKPLSDGGVPLHPFASGVTPIHGHRATVLICYEQLLPWPALTSLTEQADILLGIANDRWARSTPIPRCQQAALTAWARLFHLPFLLATNS